MIKSASSTAMHAALLLITVILTGGCVSRPLIREDFNASDSDPAGLRLTQTWQSEPFKITPFEHYRIRFRVQTDAPAMWSIAYFTEDGRELPADHYSSIDPSAVPVDHASCFKGKVHAKTAVARLHPAAGQALQIEKLVVEPIPAQAAAAWSDEIYQTLPPVAPQWPAATGVAIPRFLAGLRDGKTLRIVLLGDSIANDISNSPFDALVERLFPGSRLEVVASVRNATGCWYYRQRNRLDPYVFAFDPDLVIIAGISHRWDHEAIGDVIDQIRRRSRTEIMVMTGAVTTMQRETGKAAELFKIPQTEAAQRIADFKLNLEKLAAEKQVEWFPMRAAWETYVAASGHEADFFMRDGIHANDRGRQILARLIESYFKPLAAP